MCTPTQRATTPTGPFELLRTGRIAGSSCVPEPATSPRAHPQASWERPNENCDYETAAEADIEMGPAYILRLCRLGAGLLRVRPVGHLDFPAPGEPRSRAPVARREHGERHQST